MLDIIPDEPLKNKLIRNGFWLYFFQFLIAPTGYLLKIMISQTLSVEEVGLFYSIIGLISIISTYNDLGLTEALQYYLPHYFIDKEYSKAKTIIVFTWLMQFISGIVISGFLYFGSDRLAIHYFKTSDAGLLLKYFALYFIILNFYQVISSLFVAVQNVKRQQGVDAIRMRSIVILTFVSIYRGVLDTLTFTKRRLVGVCIALLGSRWGLKRSFWWLFRDYPLIWDKNLIKKQRTYGLVILIGVGAGTLLGQVNQQLALYMFGTKEAGYWTNYLSFYSLISILTRPIINYLFPLLNELYKKGQEDKIKILYNYLFIGISIFGLVLGILGYLFSEDIAVIFFGEDFRQSGVLFSYYAPFIITIPLIGIFFQDIASRGLIKQRVYALISGLIMNFIFSIVLGSYFGILGLVYGQLIGNITMLLQSWYWRTQKR